MSGMYTNPRPCSDRLALAGTGHLRTAPADGGPSPASGCRHDRIKPEYPHAILSSPVAGFSHLMQWPAAISTPRWRYLLTPGYNSPNPVRDRGIDSDQRGALDRPRPVSSNGPVFRRDEVVRDGGSPVRGGIPGYRFAKTPAGPLPGKSITCDYRIRRRPDGFPGSL